MSLQRFQNKNILYRLPFDILLPTSAIIYIFDYALYRSSGPDEHIHTDVTIRFGMTPGFGILTIALAAGTIILAAAMVGLSIECFTKRRPLWTEIVFVLLGVLSHPWVIARILDAILKRPF